ncbi:MAG: GH92 family glycosyl hydrolase [Terracidiphilus sp.]
MNRHEFDLIRVAARALMLLGTLSMTTSMVIGQDTRKAGPASEVNPFIGTGRGPGDSENLFPGAALPFGMVQLSPDTEGHGFGYHYDQNTIQGFSMAHMSGVGCPNEGDVFFTATTGPVQTQVADFESPYSHSRESAAPGYYQVDLSRWNVNAELTATDRTGVAQFTYPAGQGANILVPISHTLNHTVGAEVRVVGDREIDGYVTNEVFCGIKSTYKTYFAMTFSRPFTVFGTWNGHTSDATVPAVPDSREATQSSPDEQIGAYISWPAEAHPEAITAKVGISYVDQAGAIGNLKAEAAEQDFAEIRHKAEAAWNQALGVIDVSGGTTPDRRVFYTALYHSLLMPSIFSDADGRYLGFDDQIHHAAPGHLIYANYSGWDIYRSEMPLLALIEPGRMEDMAQSVVEMYKQGGWVGKWPQINRYTNVMAGSPLTIELCNAWLDGLHGFDMDTAWQGMLEDATKAPPQGHPYTGEDGMKWINTLHYVPNDKVDYGSVSQIQEDAIAYASLYRLAVKLGKTSDAKTLYDRALYYRNVFDPQDRFFRPRNADGKWVEGFDPAQEEHGFIEGSGWHYQWFVPSDMAWLVNAVGPELFNRRLTEFFNYEQPGWFGQFYNPYNETDLEVPFEFNFSGRPWESQRVVRRVLKENYTDTPDGIPGNDDAGEMSSWAVFSMMGIYPVDPASLAYELVSPTFARIVVHLKAPYQGKTFTIETSPNPQATPYIQSVQLNGHPHAQNWISFDDMSHGGALHFTLGSNPDHSWGAAPADAPPSLSNMQP